MKYILFSLSLVFVGCSHLGGDGSDEAFELVLKKPSSEKPIVTRYKTEAVSQQVKNRSFATEETSELSFIEERNYLAEKSKQDQLVFEITTRDKEGQQSLQEMAFPEPGEKLEMIYSPKAEVVSAGHYPENSIFYVPPVSLPAEPVSIGDTWVSNYQWVSLQTGLPFSLELLTIFKELQDCQGHLCALLEVSGDTSLQEGIQGSGDFSGRLWGTILFDTEEGQVVASEIKALEHITLPELLLRSSSCLKSKVEKGGPIVELACETQEFEELTPTVMNDRTGH